jgi:hypothetical protein
LLASPDVQAQNVLEVGHFVVGVGGTFGAEMNGPKVIVGWAWPRAQLSFALLGGALVIPPGPGVGGEIAVEWVAMPTTALPYFPTSRVGAIIGAHLGAKFTALSHPAFHIEGIGEYESGNGLTYAFGAIGFPQIIEIGAGHREIITNQLGPYAELRLGLPQLINAEVGVSSVSIR